MQRIVTERKVKRFESLGFKKIEPVLGRGGDTLFLMEKPDPVVVTPRKKTVKKTVKPVEVAITKPAKEKKVLPNK